MTEIRKMTEDEFAGFNRRNIEELTRVFSLTKPADEARTKAEKEQAQALPGGLNTENQYIFSIFNNDEKAGGLWFTVMSRGGADFAFLFYIYVDEEHQGRGIGQAAMGCLKNEAKNLGLSEIRLHVLKTNTRALGLYEKAGYEIYTDYEKYDRDDPGHIMRYVF